MTYIIMFNETRNETGYGIEGVSSYDKHGAMVFTVCVILVYSMSMILLLLAITRRRHHNKDHGVEIEKFLQELEEARQEAVREEVFRTVLRMPGNYIRAMRTDVQARGRLPGLSCACGSADITPLSDGSTCRSKCQEDEATVPLRRGFIQAEELTMPKVHSPNKP